MGVKRGDVVMLSSENRFEFMIASLGVMYCGAVLSTLNITYSPGKKYCIQQFGRTMELWLWTVKLILLNTLAAILGDI